MVRNAVSLGGDTDTLAAIAGAMGEAFFGMPENLKKECRNRIEKDMLAVTDRFDAVVKEDTDKRGVPENIEYSEPDDYFPKEIREKLFKD